MSIVKLKNKKLLEEIQAKLTLKIGKKFSQQEILDKSLEYLAENLEKFVEDCFPFIELSPERLREIEESASDVEYETSGDENLDIYGA